MNFKFVDVILRGCQQSGSECEIWTNMPSENRDKCNFCDTDFCNSGNVRRLEKIMMTGTLLLISVVFVFSC